MGLSERFQVHPNQITEWKKHLLEKASEVFEKGKKYSNEPDVKELHAKIGRLTMENNTSRARAYRRVERKEMIDRTHELTVSRQCSIFQEGVVCLQLGFSHSGLIPKLIFMNY